FGGVAVAVAGDAAQRDGGSGGEAAVGGAAGGDLDGGASGDRGAVQRQLPREQTFERGAGGRGQRGAAERTEDGHPGRVGVVAAGLGADDRLLDAARARLEDASEAIDDEVVADVVPAVDEAVK